MRGHFLLRRLKWDRNQCPLYGIAGCPLLRDFECIEVYRDTVRKFRNVASVSVGGCPLNGVPLYVYYKNYTMVCRIIIAAKQCCGL